jgi:hypothetical protein
MVLSAPLTTVITGGTDVLVGYTASGGQRVCVIAAPITAQITGALMQANNLRVDFFSDLPSIGGAPARIEIGAAVTFDIHGGWGSDVLVLNVGAANGPAPLLRPDGSLIGLLEGGDGDDTITANLWFDPRSLGHANVRGLGGRGNDDLTLNIYGIADDLVYALIDGGPGRRDRAYHTANVIVLNCES